MIRSSSLLTVFRNTLKLLGLLLLIIIPKCSLCLFAVSTTIAICGTTPEAASVWEYILIGGAVSVTVVFHYIKMKTRLRFVSGMLLFAGLGITFGFLLFELGSLFYYLGVGMISAVVIHSYFFESVNNKCCEIELMSGCEIDNSVKESIF